MIEMSALMLDNLYRFIIIASYTANLAAFLTVSRLDTPVESLDDLAKQYKILYAPLNGSSAMTYFQRMADIEGKFYEIWKDMSLNDSLTPVERSKLAVWDYPVSDKVHQDVASDARGWTAKLLGGGCGKGEELHIGYRIRFSRRCNGHQVPDHDQL